MSFCAGNDKDVEMEERVGFMVVLFAYQSAEAKGTRIARCRERIVIFFYFTVSLYL